MIEPRGIPVRKTITIILVVGLVGAMMTAPAHANKKKKKKQHKIEESFEAEAVPFPNLSSATGTEQRSCLAGIEGVHKVSHEFTTPARGKMTAHMSGFTGDWDLFVTDAEGKELAGSVEDQTAGAPNEEEVSLPLAGKSDFFVVACNWLGAPQAEAHLEFVYRK